MNELNDYTLTVLRKYPLGGGYYWPKDATDGVTQTLFYRGEVVAKPEAQRRTFCCGLTFEIYLKACEFVWPDFQLGEFTAADIRRMKSQWFVASGDVTGVQGALITRGLGIKVDLDEAKPGDFCQFWRSNGSGHSAIFLERVDGGMHYWTTQTSTDGIGERTEFFVGQKPIIATHFVRAFLPHLP